MKNSIKKVNSEFEIVEFDDKKVFTIKKEEEKITFYDESLVEDVISNKINETYKRILYIIMDINNSEDATESDGELVRNQIEELRNIILNKYSKYLSKELINRYLKMLLILESKLVIPERNRGR